MLELAAIADRDAVNEIAKQVHELHVSWRPDIYEPVEDLFSAEVFIDAIKARRLYVAKLSGMVLGYTLLSQHCLEGPGIVKRRVMTIDEFGIHNQCQGNGIGKTMMEDIHALARAFRCTDLQLKVYPQNDDAVGFYQKCGFQIQNIGMLKKI